MSERAIGGIETLILKYADQGRDLFELDAYIVVSNSTSVRCRHRPTEPELTPASCDTDLEVAAPCSPGRTAQYILSLEVSRLS